MLALLLCVRCVGAAPAEHYPYRWVWVFGWDLDKDSDLKDIQGLLETAAQHGINGAVLEAGLDTMTHQDPPFFVRLQKLQATCDRLGIELIPACFSIGYGGPGLSENKNLAEGLSVQDAPFTVSKDTARIVPDASVRIANGDFEEFQTKKNQFASFDFADDPGKISFVDTQVKHGGQASLRFENFTANQYGHGRINQTIHVKPHRVYRLSAWVKTENLSPVDGFNMTALVDGDRDLSPRKYSLKPTGDWKKISTLFNSMDNDKLTLYIGMWGGKAGKLWIDDWSIEEVGPINVLRRPGTPVSVKSADGKTTYVEGKDFAPLKDPNFRFWEIDRPSPALHLLPGSAIKDGDSLLVSWYHPMVIYGEQVAVCMAEPELYEILDRQAAALAQHIHAKHVLLGTDEIRMGGTCAACRGKDMAQLLGQCITKQEQIIHKYLPDCHVLVWSDMLDPNHNAVDHYYLVQGSFVGSWKYVSKDLEIAVWGSAPEEKSLKFFADQGFATLAACYYDADNLDDVKGWIHLAQGMPNVKGFMYTPWEKKYKLLGDFGELLKDQK
jgi:hypothetical protein